MHLTKSEMEIMEILWAAKEPMSRADLLNYEAEKRWKDSSVHILLNGLLRKGMITAVGFVRRSRTYGRTFAPTMTVEEYYASWAFSHMNKPELVTFMDAVLKKGNPSAEQLDQLQALIEERKKAL